VTAEVIPDFSPPEHVIQSEMAVAGAAATSAQLAEAMGDIVRPEHFRKPANGIIFGTAVLLAERGEPVDPVAVLAELTRSGELRGAGGDGMYLHDCLAVFSATPDAAPHARVVRDDAHRRFAAERLTTALDYLRSPQFDPAGGFDRARAMVDAALSPAQSRDRLPSMDELFAEVVEDLETTAPRGIPTPWLDVNEVISGLMPGELIAVAGRTSSGKSVGLLGIAAHAAIRCGVPVLLSSMEMTRQEVMIRLIASEGRIPLHVLMHRRMETEHWDRALAVRDTICAAPLVIDDAPETTLPHLRSRLRGMRREAAAGLLCVDYIGLLTATSRAENRQTEVAGFSRDLKKLAGEFGIPVVVAAQLNRMPEHRGDKVPQISDLRESGAIENDSSVVILMYREELGNPGSARAGEIDFIIGKNRHGPRATVTAAFQGHYARIVDMAPAVPR
jgi:replicative DNA helicase